jgi:hypothetical protein
MPSQWYCRVMGTEMGPLSSKQLLEMARHHQLTPNDQVRKEADGRWVEASHVRGLFEDPSASTIVMSKLPPEVLAALEASHGSHPKLPAATPATKTPAVTWHYLSDEGKVGPLSFEQLVVHGREGRLKPKTRVWSSTSPKWCAAGEVEGLLG